MRPICACLLWAVLLSLPSRTAAQDGGAAVDPKDEDLGVAPSSPDAGHRRHRAHRAAHEAVPADGGAPLLPVSAPRVNSLPPAPQQGGGGAWCFFLPLLLFGGPLVLYIAVSML